MIFNIRYDYKVVKLHTCKRKDGCREEDVWRKFGGGYGSNI